MVGFAHLFASARGCGGRTRVSGTPMCRDGGVDNVCPPRHTKEKQSLSLRVPRPHAFSCCETRTYGGLCPPFFPPARSRRPDKSAQPTALPV